MLHNFKQSSTTMAHINASVKRKLNEQPSEYKIHDPYFEKVINPDYSGVYLKPSFLTNPERLVGNAKQYYETLKSNNLVKSDGIMVIDTKSNLNLRKKITVKNVLQTFIMEDCFLGVLSQPMQIKKIENLIKGVESLYKAELDENIKTFSQKSLEIKCDCSYLTLNVHCSSYTQTYGELSNFASENENKPLQIELFYSFDDYPGVSEDVVSQLKFCKVRFEAPRFVEYLKKYALDYYNSIQKAIQKKKKKLEESDELDEIMNDENLDTFIDKYLPTPPEEILDELPEEILDLERKEPIEENNTTFLAPVPKEKKAENKRKRK